ncbi:MAG: NADPH:quinone oxidoreductase [Alphaproteobacteria bacterium]|nr:NADPH:quinone oxidoreductase [Alphaproteobacteria bacterium]
MRAAFYTQKGSAKEVLQVGDVETPSPGSGEVRIRIAASGVNPSDVKKRQGMDLEFPQIIPHSDGAGEIDAVGNGVDETRIGERVWTINGQWQRPFGTAAEFISLPSKLAVPLPDGTDAAAGACLGIPVLTAYRALTIDGDVSGQTILVAGGAGAVGHYAVQIAKLHGAEVIATVSSPEKAAHASAGGADHTIDYKRENVGERVQEITGGRGVDRIIEVDIAANAGLFPEVLRPGGTAVIYGSSNPMAEIPVLWCFRNDITFRFFIMYQLTDEVRDAAAAAINELLTAGSLQHAVAQSYPLNEIAQAHEAVESGQVMGNVVVEV